MTQGEQKMLWRGVAAGTITGVVIGLMLALVIQLEPDFFARLIQ
jgi:hypothetical protein